MAKPDGRIEKGQRLASAISARAWNRAQDAADIVLGVRPGVEAGALSNYRLPCVKATLTQKGYFGEVRWFGGESSADNLFVPTMPGSTQSIGNATDAEKELLNFAFPSVSTNTAIAPGSSYVLQRNIAICIGNDSNEYAISGFAITRLRVTNIAHRMARIPIITGASDSSAAGCLDSTWWGPVEIIGFAGPTTFLGQKVAFSRSNDETISLDNPKFYWALVRF